MLLGCGCLVEKRMSENGKKGKKKTTANLLNIILGYAFSVNHTPRTPPSRVMTSRFEKPSQLRMWPVIRPTEPSPTIAMHSSF